MWIIFSLLSALFGALMTIFIKLGLKGINPILSLTIRSIIVCLFLLVFIVVNNSIKEIKAIDKNKWIWLFLTAVVTFATWVFYYLALSKNEAYKVASLEKISIIIVFILSFFVLNEKITILGILGMILILAGSIMTSL
ncbi:MAG: EamA family transporter [Bacilli bacterium]|nr:EamA family transporter [Bacilli bacterium]